ncbi:MAG TPA: YIP1 family protein [Vicinamibacterales bacterium]|jgi:hypothetical protein
MSELSTAAVQGPRSPGWLARVAGVLVSPRRTLARALERGEWAGMLTGLALVAAVCAGSFGATAVGRQALRDNQVRSLESFGGTVTDAAYVRLGAVDRYAAAIGTARGLVGTPLVTFLLAGILFGVFNGLLGGRARFRDVLIVATYAGVVLVLEQVIAAPLDYARQAMASPLNLSDLIPVFDQGTFASWLAGSINLFRLWWLGVLAIGLSQVYDRRAARLGGALCGLYVLAGIILAAVQTATGGV